MGCTLLVKFQGNARLRPACIRERAFNDGIPPARGGTLWIKTNTRPASALQDGVKMGYGTSSIPVYQNVETLVTSHWPRA